MILRMNLWRRWNLKKKTNSKNTWWHFWRHYRISGRIVEWTLQLFLEDSLEEYLKESPTEMSESRISPGSLEEIMKNAWLSEQRTPWRNSRSNSLPRTISDGASGWNSEGFPWGILVKTDESLINPWKNPRTNPDGISCRNVREEFPVTFSAKNFHMNS